MLHITSNIFHFLGLNLRENVLAFAHFLAHNSAESLAHLVPSGNRKKDGANAFFNAFAIYDCTMYDVRFRNLASLRLAKSRSGCAAKVSKHCVLSVRIVCGDAIRACRILFHRPFSMKRAGEELKGLGEILLGEMWEWIGVRKFSLSMRT